eukprot:m.109749 g.109749  ORF g.109749 m.109749 type:complete len:367 (-) comp13380_c0_seq1:480-1580(-)
MRRAAGPIAWLYVIVFAILLTSQVHGVNGSDKNTNDAPTTAPTESQTSAKEQCRSHDNDSCDEAVKPVSSSSFSPSSSSEFTEAADTTRQEKASPSQSTKQKKRESRVLASVAELDQALARHKLFKDNVFLKQTGNNLAGDAYDGKVPWWSQVKGNAQMQHQFITPVMRTNLHKFLDADLVKRVNQGLAKTILTHWTRLYEEMVHSPPDPLQDQSSYNQLNNMLFQRYSNSLNELVEMEILGKVWDIVILGYYDNFPNADKSQRPPILTQPGMEKYVYWPTVHHWGIDHQAHTHFGSFISGVYYVKSVKHHGVVLVSLRAPAMFAIQQCSISCKACVINITPPPPKKKKQQEQNKTTTTHTRTHLK